MGIWKSKGQVIAVDPPLRDTKGLEKEYKKLRDSYKKFLTSYKKRHVRGRMKMILSDPEGAIGTKEDREKRWAVEKLKAKKTRLYLYVALGIIGAFLVILIV